MIEWRGSFRLLQLSGRLRSASPQAKAEHSPQSGVATAPPRTSHFLRRVLPAVDAHAHSTVSSEKYPDIAMYNIQKAVKEQILLPSDD